MKRVSSKKEKKPDLILTADWHLRESQPICRTDDFWEAQWDKVRQVSDLQKKYDCPVVHSGDLFNHWKPSPLLLSMCFKYLPDRFYTCYGNHDLPQHAIELSEKSGIETLRAGDRLEVIDYAYGRKPPKDPSVPDIGVDFPFLVWHEFVYQGQLPWPGCKAMTDWDVIKEFDEYNLIVTGDNHKSFVTYDEQTDTLLVNPGSLTRQTSDQVDFCPRVYLYFENNNRVREQLLEIKEDVVSREHIEKKEKHDERIQAFVEKLHDEWEMGVSFEENLNRFEKNNEVDKDIIQIIKKAIDYETES